MFQKLEYQLINKSACLLSVQEVPETFTGMSIAQEPSSDKPFVEKILKMLKTVFMLLTCLMQKYNILLIQKSYRSNQPKLMWKRRVVV